MRFLFNSICAQARAIAEEMFERGDMGIVYIDDEQYPTLVVCRKASERIKEVEEVFCLGITPSCELDAGVCSFSVGVLISLS